MKILLKLSTHLLIFIAFISFFPLFNSHSIKPQEQKQLLQTALEHALSNCGKRAAVYDLNISRPSPLSSISAYAWQASLENQVTLMGNITNRFITIDGPIPGCDNQPYILDLLNNKTEFEYIASNVPPNLKYPEEMYSPSSSFFKSLPGVLVYVLTFVCFAIVWNFVLTRMLNRLLKSQ